MKELGEKIREDFIYSQKRTSTISKDQFGESILIHQSGPQKNKEAIEYLYMWITSDKTVKFILDKPAIYTSYYLTLEKFITYVNNRDISEDYLKCLFHIVQSYHINPTNVYICKKCGYLLKLTNDEILYGGRCPKCNWIFREETKDFIRK